MCIFWKIHTPNDLTAIVRIVFCITYVALITMSWCSQGDPKTDNSPQHLSYAVCQRDRLHYRLSELHRLNNYTVFFTGLHIDCTITMFSFHDCTYRLNNYTVFIKVLHILYYIYNVFITGLHRL